MALIVVSTVTVGLGVAGVGVSMQLTVAGWLPLDDATGSTSGIASFQASVTNSAGTTATAITSF